MHNDIVNELTETERAAIVHAIETDAFRAFDNRSDGVADTDPLCDARRIGQRIADGFAMLRADG